ncbi:metalloregulator ArsR/SmtB family transcription factor [Kibdelosporangium persicum]|uniref:Transcriptional regulator n=1 Tax=Kibdelosporangium persicum TaxID=2698649 RepID=A0ABX2FA93_9PSEU|nr:transcriptional regulator [Kibdelosporangium persicum]NRN68133.1 Transcriptional regulator [Kibdelosporangium persicum]
MSSADIKAIAALDDNLRWRMYTFIRAERRPVTRDEAAASVGISRKLAAFHLDKLVDAGLLRAGYQAAGKVGRAPKVYEPANVDVRVAIPQRQHDVLAEILMDAVVAEDVQDAAVRAAAQRGEKLGTSERDKAKLGRLGSERALTVAQELLARHGFEPARDSPTCLRLRDCPFHPLAAKEPALVCGINQAFLSGLLEGLRAPTVRAVLEPTPGECCVRLRGD